MNGSGPPTDWSMEKTYADDLDGKTVEFRKDFLINDVTSYVVNRPF